MSGSNLRVHSAAGGSLDINGLTAGDVALDDTSPFYDTTLAANRKATMQRLGGYLAIGVSELRLTLTSGLSVTTADVTAAGTLYLTPHVGNRIRIYDGTRWNEYQTAEVSLALTLTSGFNYDVFAYDSGGTVTLETLVWTNDTTRATALTTQDGVLVKSGATTRLYLGTVRASAANQTEDSAAKRFCWNMYGRVPREMLGVLTANRTSASDTAVELNSEIRLQFVRGLNQDADHFWANGSLSHSTLNYVLTGIGLDGTTMFARSSQLVAGAGYFEGFDLGAPKLTGLGYHYCTFVTARYSVLVGTTTFYAPASETDIYFSACRLHGKVMA